MASGAIHILPEVNAATNKPAANGVPTPPSTPYKLLERSIDYARPMKVIVIGAGFSGIMAGVRLPQRVKNLTLTIYEKEAEVGGTWYVHFTTSHEQDMLTE